MEGESDFDESPSTTIFSPSCCQTSRSSCSEVGAGGAVNRDNTSDLGEVFSPVGFPASELEGGGEGDGDEGSQRRSCFFPSSPLVSSVLFPPSCLLELDGYEKTHFRVQLVVPRAKEGLLNGRRAPRVSSLFFLSSFFFYLCSALSIHLSGSLSFSLHTLCISVLYPSRFLLL